PAPLVAWCRASLPKLDVIALGRGLHFVQEDHPHAIGEHLAAWVRRTRAGRTPSLERKQIMIPDIHKTVIVTGGSQGIGARLVKAFLGRCYNVVATSRSI